MRQQYAVLVTCRNHNMRSIRLPKLSALAGGWWTAVTECTLSAPRDAQPCQSRLRVCLPGQAIVRSVTMVGVSASFEARVWEQGPATRDGGDMCKPLIFPTHQGAARNPVDTGSSRGYMSGLAYVSRCCFISAHGAPRSCKETILPAKQAFSSRSVRSCWAKGASEAERDRLGATGRWVRSCRNIAIFEWRPGVQGPGNDKDVVMTCTTDHDRTEL